MLFECGTNKAMTARQRARNTPRKPPPPLDRARLDALALAYVGRFATTRAKLVAYLSRKLRERGWGEPGDPATSALADRLARLGYIDDAAFALAKGRALGQRGFGRRRVAMTLRAAGVGKEDRSPAEEAARAEALSAAMRFAKRRRIGPFAAEPPDPKTRQRGLAAMIRAGHEFDLSRRIVDLPLGNDGAELIDEFGTPA